MTLLQAHMIDYALNSARRINNVLHQTLQYVYAIYRTVNNRVVYAYINVTY